MTTPSLSLAASPRPELSTSDPAEPGRPLSEPLSAPSTGTAVLEREELHSTDDGDADRFAHYVEKRKIEAAAATGRPVVALCGKVWTPGRDPNKYPVCPTCKEIYEGLSDGPKGPRGGSGGDGDGGSGGGFRLPRLPFGRGRQ